MGGPLCRGSQRAWEKHRRQKRDLYWTKTHNRDTNTESQQGAAACLTNITRRQLRVPKTFANSKNMLIEDANKASSAAAFTSPQDRDRNTHPPTLPPRTRQPEEGGRDAEKASSRVGRSIWRLSHCCCSLPSCTPAAALHADDGAASPLKVKRIKRNGLINVRRRRQPPRVCHGPPHA